MEIKCLLNILRLKRPTLCQVLFPESLRNDACSALFIASTLEPSTGLENPAARFPW